MPTSHRNSQAIAATQPPPSRSRPPKVVAVVGANSFLGRNLVGLLETWPQLRRVVAIDIEKPSTASSKTRFYEVDIAQPNADENLAEIFSAEKVHTLVHVAFLSTPTHATEWAHEFESIGTMHMLHAARQAKLRKVVQWSQTFLYGALPDNPQFIPESQPLRASDRGCFCKDKVEAEHQVHRFAETSKATVTVLRTAPILGPSVHNYLSDYLSHRLVPTCMGFDPLWQFLHESDALAAFARAIVQDVPGTFNIVSRGLLRLSTAIRLAGRFPLPVPYTLAHGVSRGLWLAQLSTTPPGFLDHLRYQCVADGTLAAEKLGYVPSHSAKDAVQDFAKAQHLRDVRLPQGT